MTDSSDAYEAKAREIVDIAAVPRNYRLIKAIATALREVRDETRPQNTDLNFGRGNLVVNTGTYGKKPAVFIAPSTNHGEIGTSAKSENHPLDKLMPGEWVLTFSTMERAKAIADLFCTPYPLSDDEKTDKLP